MKKVLIIAVIAVLLIAGGVCLYLSKNLEFFLYRKGLSEMYHQAFDTETRNIDWVKQGAISFHIKKVWQTRKFSKKYKEAYIRKMLYFLNQGIMPDMKYDLMLHVYADPQNAIECLEDKPEKYFSDWAQLLILWQIYQPEKIGSEAYRQAVDIIYKNINLYLEHTDNWSVSWRRSEYEAIVGEEYQACYAKLPCLLEALPGWMFFEPGWKGFFIPCDTAVKYDKVTYLDVFRNDGAATFFISDCPLHREYDFPQEVYDYYVNIVLNRNLKPIKEIRYVYDAKNYRDFISHIYTPDFVTADDYVSHGLVSEWAVKSYYNWKKYNDVLDYGIGFKKAVERLSAHYQQVFNVPDKQARQAALTALKPPTLEFLPVVSDTDVRYLILSGGQWENISPQINTYDECRNLIELAVANPEILSKLIDKCTVLNQGQKVDVDVANDFGKTPLMYAAQYGFSDSVKILLENGADINAQTYEGNCQSRKQYDCIYNGQRTALMYAVQEGHYDVVEYLLSAGADVKLADSQGKYAYHYLIGEAPLRDPQYRPDVCGSGGKPRRKDESIVSGFTESQKQILMELLTFEGMLSKNITMADVPSLSGKWIPLAGIFDDEVKFTQIATKPGSFHSSALAVYDVNRRGLVCFPEDEPVFYCLPVLFNKSELSEEDRVDKVVEGGFSKQLLGGTFSLNSEEELIFFGKPLLEDDSEETVLAKLKKAV